MSMSKKDYEQIASMIAAERMVTRHGDVFESTCDRVQEETLDNLVLRMNEAFAANNPMFRPALFDRRSREVGP